MGFIEKFSGVFLIAGLFLFIIGVLSLAIIPAWMVDRERTQADGVLATAVPVEFKADYENVEAYTNALRRGRDLYIREACWHCHSQYVRPISNEPLRYGPVSLPSEYQNELSLPQLFGTRRVGPDLSRESGKKTNDWQYAHLYKPTSVVPQSVMPTYPWYFDVKDGVAVPNKDAKAIVAYLQWLGRGMVTYKDTANDFQESALPPAE